MGKVKSQGNLELLVDEKNGRVVDWQLKKSQSLQVAQSYNRLATNYSDTRYNKYLNMSRCGEFLEFKKTDIDFKLHRANFCRIRLCPMCSWRRSLKIFGQLSKVINYIKTSVDVNYKYVFLTLTIKNVCAEGLSLALDEIFKAFKLFTKCKDFNNSFVGFFRSLEVTRNSVDGTYHPHLHCVLLARPDYYTRRYITHDRLVELWQRALKVDYIPVVDIRKVKDIGGNIAEVSKYATKPTDILQENVDLTDNIVDTLDLALKGRRLCAFGGLFKEIHRQLNLDDMEDGDLVNTDNEQRLADEDVSTLFYLYRWRVGYNGEFNYYRKC